MAVFGIGAILLLLFLLGCTLAVIVAVGFAVAHGRFALAAVIGGGSFVFVIVAAVLLALFASTFQGRVVVNEPSAFKTTIENAPPAQFEVTALPEINASLHFGSQPHWRISLFPAIVLIAAVAFLLARFG